MKSYQEIEKECIDLVCKICEVEPERISGFTSDQLKELVVEEFPLKDVPVDGEALAPLPIETGKRDQLPKSPFEPAIKNSTCDDEPIEFVDILYVPAHPKDGKKRWYAMTQVAVDAIKKEKNTLSTAIIAGNKLSTLQNLNNLGLLSKFQSKPHEYFLKGKDKDRYRALILVIKALQSGASAFYEQGDLGFIEKVMGAEGLDLQDMIGDQLSWEKFKDDALVSMAKPAYMGYMSYTQTPLYEELNSNEADQRRLIRARKKIRSKLIKHCEEVIEDLEKKAEVKASKTTTDLDGTKFAFDKKHQYFTSRRQKNIDYHVSRLFKNRPDPDNKFCMDEHDDVVEAINDFWVTDLGDANEHERSGKQITRSDIGLLKPLFFLRSLNQLNAYGYAVKEQCLTEEEFEGTEPKHLGPSTLNLSTGWRSGSFFSSQANPLDFLKETNLINDLYKEIKGDSLGTASIGNTGSEDEQTRLENTLDLKGNVEWAYLPTLALIQVIDETFKKQFSDLKTILGTGDNLPNFLSQLIWVKKVAVGRLDILKKKAEKRATEGKLRNTFIDNPLQTFKLLWDETKHKPKRVKLGVFQNQADLNDLEAVECCFLSDGEVFWVRGPHWYMPETGSCTELHLGHVKPISVELNPPSASSSTGDVGKTLKEGLKEFKPNLGGTQILNLSKEVHKFESAFWQDGFHYKDGVGPDGKAAYIANAEAQFMRFSSSASGSINTPIDKAKFSGVYGTSGEIKASLTLLSAQMGFAVWLPFSDKNKAIDAQTDAKRDSVEGYAVSIPYYVSKKDTSGEVKVERADTPYDAGHICIQLRGKVYGLAAASCQLSASVAFGPADTDGGIGVKGQAYAATDYNKRLSGSKTFIKDLATSEDTLTSAVAEGKVQVDVFAGVEAGGSFGADVYWRPPKIDIALSGGNKAPKPKLLKLGGLDGELAVSAGYGFSAELRLTFQDGFLVLIAAARLVAGPGCKGKVGIAINPVNADRFITCVLGVLRQNDFRYIAFFGDRDEKGANRDFEMLNERLTVAIAMGLALSDVLMLPAVVFEQYKKDSLQEDYAPLIADSILRKDRVKSVQPWVSGLPPETLSNLLSCLINAQDTSDLDFFTGSARQGVGLKNNDTAALQNENQVGAILKIMQWIPLSQENASLASRRQFQKSLVLMDGNIEDYRTPREQWQRLFENWQKIGLFISRYSNRNSKRKNISEFNRRSSNLCLDFDVYLDRDSFQLFGVELISWKKAILIYNGENLTNKMQEENNLARIKISQTKAKNVGWNIRVF
ncbi:hypothetical protein [Enterovibrio norvegicus]|uniref:hypothetical protein n=1 Tax=Enterovibrio norvegicus TaxID=188144 RepID=UPI000C85921C|nr:hypothetical protein [Enterovibrio norvegicus]PML79074.1 hypothetical protein BCT69_14650 [Enterovibrio norvegicus]